MTEMKPIDCDTTREVITSVVGDRVIISFLEVGRPVGTALGNDDAAAITLVVDALGKALGDRLGEVLGDRLGEALGDRLGEVLADKLGEALGNRLEEALGDGLGEALDSTIGKLGNVGSVMDEPPAKDTAASAKPRPTITDDSPKDIDTLARIVP